MKLMLTVFGTVLLLSGCNLYQQHEAKAKVRDLLRDPQSAQFSDVRTTGNGLLVCGMVNAKNGMGGYVGKRTFVVWGDHDAAVASDEIESIRYDTCCMLLERAARERIDSDALPDFGRACDGVTASGFKW